MTAECRPPEGTPDGTVCWMTDGAGKYECVQWEAGAYIRFGMATEYTPRYFSACGWRFHSIATLPEGEG